MRKLTFGLLATSMLTFTAAAAERPAPLDVVLHPHASGGVADRMDVELRIAHPGVAAGQPLLRMPTTVVSTPTAGYDASAIVARDDKGPLPLTMADEAPTPTGAYRHYDVGRTTVGDVVVRYGTPPRAVSVATRNGPLFDLRQQADGLMGAGVYFMALPAGEQPYRISLKWDLSGMPKGARGIWSLGEGDQSTVGPAELLAFSFYATGSVKSVPAEGQGNFGLYWLVQPPFDVNGLATGIQRLYGYMAHFFKDDGAPYRVFIRANPYPAGGGTALARSFMFGYGVDGTTASSDTQMLLAHEMTHNWPRLDGGEHAATAWYTEGMAEYYSVVLALRAGVIDQAKFLRVVNDHASGYYTNPYVALTNTQAGAKFWSDARAQRVPYGRGFMYLARIDAEIRAKSGGTRNLDNLVLEVLDRQRKGEKVDLEQWVAMVVRELGDGARQEYEDMVAGKLIEPAPTGFAPCYHAVKAPERPFDLGYDEMRLGVVADLRPDSPAAQAGVKEGDVIVRSSPKQSLMDDPTKQMEITVKRDGQERSFTYLPRGQAVTGWHWERVPGVEDGACHL
ncbi:M61 glycyl aminopeptidase [Nitrospirillum amazonense]|uniref:M61 glycyl aminopeptidase n=1 Tax=Nitrospirillum amazonense TaxID=28077 RepID=A0A560EWX7_9PROT|nr:hypothetical protein [Nitrospirillum amazonense]TWB13858.1 M61 glycyl aminopeptidase [Nitrospirillum amazonense]